MPPADASPDTADAHRLPRTVAPTTYSLVLEPDLDAATFDGTAEIDLVVHEPTSSIVCNAAELTVTGASITVGGVRQPAASVELDEARERVTFTFAEPVGAGTARLDCSFAGVLNDKLRGFYRSRFTGADGEEHTIATTQMESVDARRAFPCWDEPDRKAVFDITLVVDEHLAAFSNCAVVEDVPTGDGRRRVHFAPTMVMSSYLVAFIVGPLEATDPVDVGGVPVRVVHAPGKQHLTGFALEVAAHALRFFTDYFAIDYPSDKLDLVAIPDFAMGAMENLGCVTFRETALLVDTATAARTDLERVADVVAHEIAHMWFGDLVTMGWWEGIWLNEAFATFMEVACVDTFRPAWERWLSFGLEREMALDVDGLHSTRPIEFPVGPPQEAEAMFDVLTYQKGGSVLRMLEQYLGPETFRDGIRRYLATHAYANTVTADLWAALEAASGLPVRAVMDTWILQGGHPLVTLADGELRQEPFTFRPARAGEASAIGHLWQVPVRVRALGSTEVHRQLLSTEAAPVEPAGRAVGTLAVANAGGWGVYRSAYPTAALEAMAGRLADFDPLERAVLFGDVWAAVLAGRSALGAFFSLAAGLGPDPEPTTWTVVAGALGLCNRIVGDAGRPGLAAATRALLGPRFAALGFDARPDDDERTPTLRGLLIRALGTVGADPAVRAEAARRFDRAVDAGEPIDTNIEGAVLAAVTAQDREGDDEKLLVRFRTAPTPQEEQRALLALAGFPDPPRAARTFEFALSEVRSQDAPFLIRELLANRVAGPSVFELITERWDEILAKFPVSAPPRMLSAVSGLCGDPSAARRATDFLTAHPLPAGGRSVDQTLERLGNNLAFAERERPGLDALLADVAAG
jgi:puromycin-sensitive aminopeptidase